MSRNPTGPPGEPSERLTPDFSELRDEEVIVRYAGVDLEVLARGPRVGPSASKRGPTHEGSWLISWRDGGELSRPPGTPVDLAGVEHRLAVPLSEQRRSQAESERMSLRELIAFAEWDPFLLTGPDPRAPERVQRIPSDQMPSRYLPTDDVSIRGRRLHDLSLSVDGSEGDVLVHVVADGDRQASTFLRSGTIQEGLARYIEWAGLAAIYGASHVRPRAAQVLPETVPELALVSAEEGSLRINARIVVVGESGKEAAIRALEAMSQFSAGGDGQIWFDESRVAPSRIASYALHGILEFLSNSGLSLNLKWRGPRGIGSVLIGGRASRRMADQLDASLETAAERDRVSEAIVTVTITKEEGHELLKHVDRNVGGFEQLLDDLAHKTTPIQVGYALALTARDIERIVRYVQRYGEGGAQKRLLPVYLAVYRLGIAFSGLR